MNVYVSRSTAVNPIFQWIERHRLILTQILIVCGVIGITAVVSYLSPRRFGPYIIGLPVLLAGILILFRWPPLGFILFFPASMLLKIPVPYVGLAAALLMGLTALWIVNMVMVKKSVLLVNSPTVPPILLFVAVILLAFGVGQFPWFSLSPAPLRAQIGSIAIYTLSLCAFLLTAHQIRNVNWLKAMLIVFIALGACATFIKIFPGLPFLGRDLFHRKIGGGSLFWIWLVVLAASQALFNQRLAAPWRILLGGVVGAALYGGMVLSRAWSSGWVPPLIALGVLLWIGAPRLAFPLSMAVAGVVLFSSSIVNDLIYVGDNEYSAMTRVEAWRIVLDIVKVNPILGLGPANYYFYTPLFSILGWYVQFNSHNNYVDIIAQTGLLGLICFIWFVIALAQAGWKLLPKLEKGSFEYAYALGCLSGLVGTVVAGMLGDWMLPFVYNIGIDGLRASGIGWLFMGGLVALEQITAVRQRATV